jgi:hypothetical protein
LKTLLMLRPWLAAEKDRAGTAVARMGFAALEIDHGAGSGAQSGGIKSDEAGARPDRMACSLAWNGNLENAAAGNVEGFAGADRDRDPADSFATHQMTETAMSSAGSTRCSHRAPSPEISMPATRVHIHSGCGWSASCVTCRVWRSRIGGLSQGRHQT